MSKFITILILIVATNLYIPVLALAQKKPERGDTLWLDESRFESYGYHAMSDIKAEIQQLLEDNKRLMTGYQSLQQNVSDFQSKVNQSRKEIEVLREKLGFVVDIFWESKDGQQVDERDVEKLKNDILIKEGQITFLRGQLIDTDEELRLKKLKIADLQLEKREIQLNRKLDEVMEENSSVQEVKKNAENRLLKEINTNKKETARILQSIKDLKRERESRPSVQKQLKQEIKQLEHTVKELEKDRALKYKEVSLLMDKRSLILKLLEGKYWDENERKRMLEEKVAMLEIEYAELNNALDAALSKQAERQKLLKEIILLDKENQNLRNKISILQPSY